MSKQPNYVFDDELYHHGIQGQRWGFRRFQNEDGSWTPEGRERYGKGENPYKKEVKKYFVQKFKADIKSQKSKDKNTRLAREERHKLREWGKTQRLAKKEQAKIDGSKNPAIQDTRNMSDDDLQKAINRLKLQSEYNKQYTLATNPNGALAKADRFFEGPTGQVVKAVAVATLPKVAETATSKILESNLKYANSLDREKARAEIEKTRAEAKNPSKLALDKIPISQKVVDRIPLVLDKILISQKAVDRILIRLLLNKILIRQLLNKIQIILILVLIEQCQRQ